MPIYHYHCKSCDYDFTQKQAFSDDALKTCPQCGKDTLRKVFSAAAINFKGGGFYRTDHPTHQSSSNHHSTKSVSSHSSDSHSSKTKTHSDTPPHPSKPSPDSNSSSPSSH